MRPFIWLVLISLMAACSNKSYYLKEEQNPLLAYFYQEKQASKDTLTFYAEQEEFEGNDQITALPDTLLTKYLSPALMERLNFTGSGEYFAAQQFSLDKQTIACLVLTRDNWYKMESLLLFNKKQKKFFDLVPVAQLYGGESGQVYLYSCLYDQAGDYFLFSKNLEHWMSIPDEDTGEVTEKNTENNYLKKWHNGNFKAIAIPDSAWVSQLFSKKIGLDQDTR